ncbi:MAG: PAS domain-containing protein [Gammaproteobacteria bacterium]
MSENKATNFISCETIISLLPGHVYWKNKNGIYLGCNKNQARDLGFSSPDDIIGKSDFDLSSKTEAELVRNNDLNVMTSGQPKIVEEPGRSIAGKKIVYLTHKVPLYNQNKEVIGILGISLDITDAKKEEAEKLETLERIISVMPGHVYWKNRDCILQGCNDNQAKDAGLPSRKDIVGKNAYDLLWQNQPEDDKREQAAITDRIDKEVMDFGAKKTIEEFIVMPDGSKASMLSEKVPLKDEKGKVIGLVGISFDITKQKEQEKKLKEAEIKDKLHEEKNKVLQSFGACIAHELRTPLNSIYNYTSAQDYLDIVFEGYKLAKDANLPVKFLLPIHINSIKEAFKDIAHETIRVNKFIDMLLTSIKSLNTDVESAIVKENFEKISICSCVENALERYAFNSSDERQLINWSDKNDFHILGDPIVIEHILFNLIKNAIYYIRVSQKGEISIWLEKGSKYNRLYFKDTGQGIAEDILPKIFDHFFSKREEGTGTGLAFCKWAMESMKGRIDCDSKLGEYTKFILEFPII